MNSVEVNPARRRLCRCTGMHNGCKGRTDRSKAVRSLVALTRFLEDRRIEADNNIAERALRGVAIGRKNYLHFGSDGGGAHGGGDLYADWHCQVVRHQSPSLFALCARAHCRPSHQPDRELLPWAVAQHLGRGVAQPLPLAA